MEPSIKLLKANASPLMSFAVPPQSPDIVCSANDVDLQTDYLLLIVVFDSAYPDALDVSAALAESKSFL